MDDITILENEIKELKSQLNNPDVNKAQIYDQISQLQGRISEIKIHRFLEGLSVEDSSEK